MEHQSALKILKEIAILECGLTNSESEAKHTINYPITLNLITKELDEIIQFIQNCGDEECTFGLLKEHFTNILQEHLLRERLQWLIADKKLNVIERYSNGFLKKFYSCAR